MRLPTGGQLNLLNERARTNSRARSVPVADLVRKHQPHTPSQLRRLIETHHRVSCECGIRSQGPVEQFALNLYQVQFTDATYQREHDPLPFDACMTFMHALFCVAPLRGVNMEALSRTTLERECVLADSAHVWSTREATQEEDAGCAVDYILLRDQMPFVGVQVKPDSVLARTDVLALNLRKQKRFAHPVHFHTYRVSDLTFPCDHSAVVARRIVQQEPDQLSEPAHVSNAGKPRHSDAAPSFW